MEDPTAALRELDTTLDSLEAAVAPLLARSRGAMMDKLGNVDKAKMDVLLAFAINNLVWVYLRSRGIDPDEHQVASELERIKSYYGKVRAAEGSAGPSRRIDVPAAARIISHSLPSKRSLAAAAPSPITAAAALARQQAAAATGPGRATRFRHIANQGEKLLPGQSVDDDRAAMDVDEEGNLEQGDVGDIEDDTAAAAESLLAGVEAEIVAEEVAEVVNPKKGKGKSKASKSTKRKRS